MTSFHRRPLGERLRLFRESVEFGPVAALVGVMTAALLVAGFAPAFVWIIGVLLGAALAGHGARWLSRVAAVKNWPTVEGTVLESEVRELAVPYRTHVSVHHYPSVRVEYYAGGGRRTAEGFTIAPRDHADVDPEAARSLLASYRPGTRVAVRLSPRDPGTAVLHTEVSRRTRSHYLALVIAGILIIGASIWAGL